MTYQDLTFVIFALLLAWTLYTCYHVHGLVALTIFFGLLVCCDIIVALFQALINNTR